MRIRILISTTVVRIRILIGTIVVRIATVYFCCQGNIDKKFVRSQQLSLCREAAVKRLLVQRYGVIFTFSGPLRLWGSTLRWKLSITQPKARRGTRFASEEAMSLSFNLNLWCFNLPAITLGCSKCFSNVELNMMLQNHYSIAGNCQPEIRALAHKRFYIWPRHTF